MNYRIEKKMFGSAVVVYDCPLCGEELKSTQDEIGQTHPCPACGGEFVVPGPDPVPAAPASPPPVMAVAVKPAPSSPAVPVAAQPTVMEKPLQSQLVILGSMSLGGNIIPVENLAESLQVAHDAGAKRLLLPMASVGDIPTIPGELFAKFQTGFYSDPRDAAFKALGVE